MLRAGPKLWILQIRAKNDQKRIVLRTSAARSKSYVPTYQRIERKQDMYNDLAPKARWHTRAQLPRRLGHHGRPLHPVWAVGSVKFCWHRPAGPPTAGPAHRAQLSWPSSDLPIEARNSLPATTQQARRFRPASLLIGSGAMPHAVGERGKRAGRMIARAHCARCRAAQVQLFFSSRRKFS